MMGLLDHTCVYANEVDSGGHFYFGIGAGHNGKSSHVVMGTGFCVTNICSISWEEMMPGNSAQSIHSVMHAQ